ncbi:MAG: hypothetical protein D6812_02540 [Deltaproteobacteria bacterium]|nr:MAG: hypothetical protein D6812_02540 [Deltaproteobacteria bacterium]
MRKETTIIPPSSFSAYLLGELPEADRKVFEASLAADEETSDLLDLTHHLYTAIVEGGEVTLHDEAIVKEAEARSWARIEEFLAQEEEGEEFLAQEEDAEVIPFLPPEAPSPLAPTEAARATLRKVFEVGIALAGKCGLRENEVFAALEDALETRLEESAPPETHTTFPAQAHATKREARLADHLRASPELQEAVDRFTRGEKIEAPGGPVEEILEVMAEAGTARLLEEEGKRKFQILENRIPLCDRSSLAAILDGTRAVLEVFQTHIDQLFSSEGHGHQTLRHLRFLARRKDLTAFRKRLLQMLRAEVMKLDAHASAQGKEATTFVLHFGLAPATPEAGKVEQKDDSDRKIGRL